MADENPIARRSNSNNANMNGGMASTPGRAGLSPLARSATLSDLSARRRSSFVTNDSLDARSFRSSSGPAADELLLPRVQGSHRAMEESSHLHSVPLAMALLPAVGGLLFANGSAIVTDITLLLLAAVFLNWSVRLPWDWYHNAQAMTLSGSAFTEELLPPDDTIIEEREDEADGNAEKKDGEAEKSSKANRRSSEVKSARSELKVHELLALLACFVCPMLGAWVLHAIRGQLSRPSEGLVSDYNLTIFLLAAEIRPMAHLIKMVQARTLFLQRVVNSNPFESEEHQVEDLAKRLDELEAHVADGAAVTGPFGKVAGNSNSSGSSVTAATVTAEVRKSVQPELDALNRAVRRYEKRATMLSMQTEARLQGLEARLTDALTLAAAAERSTSRAAGAGKGSAAVLLNWICAAVVMPARAAMALLGLPLRVAARLLEMAEALVGSRVRRELRTAGKAPARPLPIPRSQSRGVKKAA